MTDPAAEAARRVAEKIIVCGFGNKLYPSDLLLAAREALAPLRELHKRVVNDSGRPGCATCGWVYGWPCSTARFIYRTDEL